MIHYSVQITLEMSLLSQFNSWIKNHVQDMLTLPGFVQARVLRSLENPTHFWVDYEVQSQKFLDDYFKNHADQMRLDGIKHFPKGLQISREIFEQAAFFQKPDLLTEHRMHTVFYYRTENLESISADPLPKNYRIIPLKNISVDYYRYLFRKVGDPYKWASRNLMNDVKLDKEINKESTIINVLQEDGQPIGFCEVDRDQPHKAELVFFGLIPNKVGKGLGRRYLAQSLLEAAAKYDIHEYWLHTCEFDHPSAQILYKKLGFKLEQEVRESIELPIFTT